MRVREHFHFESANYQSFGPSGLWAAVAPEFKVEFLKDRITVGVLDSGNLEEWKRDTI
jgi:hypothetical protein